uniref:uncharacterized protein LOC108949415 n=1 Tax=Ciona intestinalis TaxID=7719 RepID=UPI000EF50E23|nr:uncharacterized protein LOC108949415 [Ciona intestinalis]|eukprot:XP_026689878.1 uncharacterized protein LOC108949415 [Ciona intestinalis]
MRVNLYYLILLLFLLAVANEIHARRGGSGSSGGRGGVSRSGISRTSSGTSRYGFNNRGTSTFNQGTKIKKPKKPKKPKLPINSKTLKTFVTTAVLLKLASKGRKRIGFKPPLFSTGYTLYRARYLGLSYNVNGNQYWTPHLIPCSNQRCLKNCLIVPLNIDSLGECRDSFRRYVNNQTRFKFPDEYPNTALVRTSRSINVCCNKNNSTTRAEASFYVLMLSLLIAMLH